MESYFYCNIGGTYTHVGSKELEGLFDNYSGSGRWFIIKKDMEHAVIGCAFPQMNAMSTSHCRQAVRFPLEQNEFVWTKLFSEQEIHEVVRNGRPIIPALYATEERTSVFSSGEALVHSLCVWICRDFSTMSEIPPIALRNADMEGLCRQMRWLFYQVVERLPFCIGNRLVFVAGSEKKKLSDPNSVIVHFYTEDTAPGDAVIVGDHFCHREDSSKYETMVSFWEENPDLVRRYGRTGSMKLWEDIRKLSKWRSCEPNAIPVTELMRMFYDRKQWIYSDLIEEIANRGDLRDAVYTHLKDNLKSTITNAADLSTFYKDTLPVFGTNAEYRKQLGSDAYKTLIESYSCKRVAVTVDEYSMIQQVLIDHKCSDRDRRMVEIQTYLCDHYLGCLLFGEDGEYTRIKNTIEELDTLEGENADTVRQQVQSKCFEHFSENASVDSFHKFLSDKLWFHERIEKRSLDTGIHRMAERVEVALTQTLQQELKAASKEDFFKKFVNVGVKMLRPLGENLFCNTCYNTLKGMLRERSAVFYGDIYPFFMENRDAALEFLGKANTALMESFLAGEYTNYVKREARGKNTLSEAIDYAIQVLAQWESRDISLSTQLVEIRDTYPKGCNYDDFRDGYDKYVKYFGKREVIPTEVWNIWRSDRIKEMENYFSSVAKKGNDNRIAKRAVNGIRKIIDGCITREHKENLMKEVRAKKHRIPFASDGVAEILENLPVDMETYQNGHTYDISTESTQERKSGNAASWTKRIAILLAIGLILSLVVNALLFFRMNAEKSNRERLGEAFEEYMDGSIFSVGSIAGLAEKYEPADYVYRLIGRIGQMEQEAERREEVMVPSKPVSEDPLATELPPSADKIDMIMAKNLWEKENYLAAIPIFDQLMNEGKLDVDLETVENGEPALAYMVCDTLGELFAKNNKFDDLENVLIYTYDAPSNVDIGYFDFSKPLLYFAFKGEEISVYAFDRQTMRYSVWLNSETAPQQLELLENEGTQYDKLSATVIRDLVSRYFVKSETND